MSLAADFSASFFALCGSHLHRASKPILLLVWARVVVVLLLLVRCAAGLASPSLSDQSLPLSSSPLSAAKPPPPPLAAAAERAPGLRVLVLPLPAFEALAGAAATA